MSKKSKSKSKARRLQAKRSKRAAMQAKYASFAAEGARKGSKRTKLKSRRAKAARTTSHPNGACGNVGCMRCHAVSFAPWLIDGVPRAMPPRMYQRWVAAGSPRR